MQKLIKKLSNGSVLFIVLALLAVLVMGSTARPARVSDLDAQADKLLNESSFDGQGVNIPAQAILRANVIGK